MKICNVVEMSVLLCWGEGDFYRLQKLRCLFVLFGLSVKYLGLCLGLCEQNLNYFFLIVEKNFIGKVFFINLICGYLVSENGSLEIWGQKFRGLKFSNF